MPGTVIDTGPTTEDKVDMPKSLMSFPGPLSLPPLMFSSQTAWVTILVPHFQLCDIEQVTLPLWASIVSAIKWGQASIYFIGILREKNEFTYVKYLTVPGTKSSTHVCVCS